MSLLVADFLWGPVLNRLSAVTEGFKCETVAIACGQLVTHILLNWGVMEEMQQENGSQLYI